MSRTVAVRTTGLGRRCRRGWVKRSASLKRWLTALVSARRERSRPLRGSCFLFMGVSIQEAQDLIGQGLDIGGGCGRPGGRGRRR